MAIFFITLGPSFPISLPWHSLGYTIDDRQITTTGLKASKLEDDPTALNGTGW